MRHKQHLNRSKLTVRVMELDMTKHLVMQEDPALFMAFDEYTRCVILDALFRLCHALMF